MLKPKDIIDQLGVSAPTLRVWSKTFAPVLSPAAQPSRTETGGAAQRRYTEQDLAYFRKAKQLLDSGLTFEQALATLQAEDPPQTARDSAVVPVTPQPPAEVALYSQLAAQSAALTQVMELQQQTLDLIKEVRADPEAIARSLATSSVFLDKSTLEKFATNDDSRFTELERKLDEVIALKKERANRSLWERLLGR